MRNTAPAEVEAHPDAVAVAAMLAEWLGSGVAIVTAPVGPDYPLHPAEAALVARAGAARRASFAAGRWCAHRALRQLGDWPGDPEHPLLAGALRQPLWPDGATGSITHDGGLCAAVAQRTKPGRPSGIGVDILARARATERPRVTRRMAAANGPEGISPAHLFSMRESVVKALSASVNAWMIQDHIRITRGSDGETFWATYPAPGGAGHLRAWVRAGETGAFHLSAATLCP